MNVTIEKIIKKIMETNVNLTYVEFASLIEEIKEKDEKIKELEEKSTVKNQTELKKYIETNWEEFERWWNSVLNNK